MQDKPTRRDLMLKPREYGEHVPVTDEDISAIDAEQSASKAHVFYEGETVEIRDSRFAVEKINRKRMTLRLLQPGDDGKRKNKRRAKLRR